jgi:hypothetical protein
MSKFSDKIRAAAGAAANVLRETTPKAIEKLDDMSSPQTDFEKKLVALGVAWRPTGAEATALAAIEEAQAYALDLAAKVNDKQRTIESLQSSLIAQQNGMQSYVKQGADDQLYYLTEFLQQRFPNDFQGNEDVVVLSKRLLLELHQRRQGKMRDISQEKFIAAFRAALKSLEADASGGIIFAKDLLDSQDGLLFRWDAIQERVKRALGLHDANDMRVDYITMNEDTLDLASCIVDSEHYYGFKKENS